jgi:RNAse (barnase) inhibitor barstar
MDNWGSSFASYLNSGVYPGGSSCRAAAVKQAAVSCKLEYFQIELKQVKNKAGFLAQVARELDFPDYFGRNWDALSDCLADLSWRPAAGYVILFNDFRRFANVAPADAEKARRIFDSCAAQWKQKKVPFFVVLCGTSAVDGP